MTRPPPLYPARRLTWLVVTICALALAVAGLTIVVVTQDVTLSDLKDKVAASDTHRHADIEALKESDAQLRRVLVASLNAALVEIRRLQALVRRLGGNPGSFPTTAGSSPAPTPRASSGPRPSPAASVSSSPRASPSRSPSRSPRPSPSPSRSCVLPPPAVCLPPPVTALGAPPNSGPRWYALTALVVVVVLAWVARRQRRIARVATGSRSDTAVRSAENRSRSRASTERS